MASVYVVETLISPLNRPLEWEPRSVALDKLTAIDEMRECRFGEGGRWRVREYVRKR